MISAQQIAMWADRLRDLSALGLWYATSQYDTDRYQAIQDLALEMLAAATGETVASLEPLRAPIFSRPTPFASGDAAIIDDDGRILLIQRADNGRWAMPGGALEVGETPAEGVAREAFEETGYRCTATALVGVFDSRYCGTTSRHHLYQFVFVCRLDNAQPAVAASHAHEVRAMQWFAWDALPPDLDPGHVSRIPIAFEVWNRQRAPYFDQVAPPVKQTPAGLPLPPMVQYNPQCMSALNPHVRNVTEATFARYVLRAPLPVLVCFGARDCPGYRAMQPVLKRVAQAQAEHLQVAAMQIEREGLVAIQYGVELSPTLVVFHAGDAQGCVRGFVPEGLVQLFAEDVVRGSVHDYQIWSPVEKHFEDSVLVPLLESWNMAYQRQVSCQTGQAGTRKRGQVDFVMYAEAHGAPVALIESKRQIRNEQELRQAACQGASYAASLNVPAFAVAAPSGLWLYRSAAPARPVKHFSSLDIHRYPEQPKQVLMQICHELS